MSGAAHRSVGNSLLRVSQACETLLAGFNSGQAAAVKSCLVSREHAMSVSERRTVGTGSGGTELLQKRSNLLLPLEDAMATRRARPSLLLPAWRAVGFAVGTGTAALLPAEASARVGDAITRAVTEQYDANIRSMYEARIVEEESEVKELFKTQRDEPSRAALESDAGGDESGAASEDPDEARSMAVVGTLKSALRMACTVTAKV